MNEQQFIAKIEEMRREGLCNTNEESAKRYAAQLRAGSDLSLAVAEEEVGICTPGQSILDLETPEQLEKLDQWQGVTVLSDRERAAVKLFLKMHGITPVNKKAALQTELAKEESKEAARMKVREAVSMKRQALEGVHRDEPPLSLYGLLAALRQSTKNRRSTEGDPPYTLLMRALLLNKNYYWNSDSTERHLRRWGGNYYEYAQVILANVHNDQRRELVKEAMREALHTLEDGTMGPELRLDVARACLSLEEDMELWKLTQENPDEEWGRYEGSEAQLVLQQLASMHKGTISHIYKNIAEDDLIDLIVRLFSLAIDASEGRFPPAPDPEERLEQLGPDEKALLAVVTCGLPMKRKHWTMEEIQPMLLKLLLAGVLVPERGVGRFDKLVLTKGIKPVGTTKAMDSMIRDRWSRDERIIRTEDIKISLEEALTSKDFTGKGRDRVWKLLQQLLKKSDSEDINELKWALTEQLEPVLEKVHGEEELTLLDFLVRCHWGRLDVGNDLVAIESLDKLLLWMERYPGEMEKIWLRILPGTSMERKAEALYRTGGSMIHAELHSTCASRCLARASDQYGSTRAYWSSCAVSQAEKALVQLRNLQAPTVASQAARTKAMGYALLGDRTGCEEALEEAKRWSDQSFTDTVLEPDPVGNTREACEEQLALLKDVKPLNPRFYGWFQEDRSYDMVHVRNIVMGALNRDKMTESMLLLCMQVWERIPLNSRLVGWQRLADKMAEIDMIYKDNPDADADLICNHLISQDVLDSGTLGIDNGWRLKKLADELKRKDM